jgi:hypothetical protein
LQLLLHSHVFANIEQSFDLRRLRAGAHQLPPALAAEHQLERADQNALARPRFAGEHVQAGTELELELVDDGEVANSQAREHGRSSLASPLSCASVQADIIWPAARNCAEE